MGSFSTAYSRGHLAGGGGSSVTGSHAARYLFTRDACAAPARAYLVYIVPKGAAEAQPAWLPSAVAWDFPKACFGSEAGTSENKAAKRAIRSPLDRSPRISWARVAARCGCLCIWDASPEPFMLALCVTFFFLFCTIRFSRGIRLAVRRSHWRSGIF